MLQSATSGAVGCCRRRVLLMWQDTGWGLCEPGSSAGLLQVLVQVQVQVLVQVQGCAGVATPPVYCLALMARGVPM